MHDQAASTDNQHFSSAIALLEKLIDSPAIVLQLDLDRSANAQQVYTNAATIFALILQRLGGGLTLKQTVTRMEPASKRLLPDRRGKRTSPRGPYRKRPKATKFEVNSPQEAAEIREANRKRVLE